MVWLLKSYEGSFDEFSCEGFEDVIQTDAIRKELDKLIKDHVCLHTVKKLDLSNCGLRKCPASASITLFRGN